MVAPIGSASVPLAQITVEDVLDVLHDQVDGHCNKAWGRLSSLAPTTPAASPLPTVLQNTHGAGKPLGLPASQQA